MDSDDDLDLIRSRLDTLRPITRAVFLLHRIDGLGYEKIAWRLGIDRKAVERHMAKAIYRIAWPSWRERVRLGDNLVDVMRSKEVCTGSRIPGAGSCGGGW